eukprot:gnl/TRDRNA2_/TRDRNA2_167271_c2_seq2.p1 gnl/TRDRNA2_/TRDRNA2_167271_c2~~gnl/TRDRNA2_/TRDRNA2_167271_c2_seq2.p1  ORF type:complete len:539 (-),score=102.11 gnl/TRDRNA2_/TRDRNA2_167271_c2_seq2:56-1672(-)
MPAAGWQKVKAKFKDAAEAAQDLDNGYFTRRAWGSTTNTATVLSQQDRGHELLSKVPGWLARLGALLERGRVSEVRAELDEVAKLIRDAELMLRRSRTERAELVLHDADKEGCLGADLEKHGNELSRVFTEKNFEVAEGYDVLTSCRSGDTFGKSASHVCRLRTDLDGRISVALASKRVEELLGEIGSLGFDALAFAALPEVEKLPLPLLCACVTSKRGIDTKLESSGRLKGLDLGFRERLVQFMEQINRKYQDNPYHGAAHAVDVMMTSEWFFQSDCFKEQMDTLDHLMGLVAGAIHDVGHPGTNNLFHAKTMSPMALRYNDESILENMHVSLAFETMHADESCNWFSLLSSEFRQGDEQTQVANLQQYVRKGLITMVLGTDMAKHAKHVHQLKDFAADLHNLEVMDRKLFLLSTILHAADVSNGAKPRPIMLGWTERVLAEFWNQGDEEHRLGLPVSPLCDRASGRREVPKGQIGFIGFVLKPLFAPLEAFMPEVEEALTNLDENSCFWEEKANEHAMPEDLFPGSLLLGTNGALK